MMFLPLLIRNTLLAVHLLSAVIWVGGAFAVIVLLRPALATLDAGPRVQVQMNVLKKYFFYVWHVMPLMLLTGWAMIYAAWGSFAILPLSINIMQGLALIMAGIAVYTFFVPWQRLRRSIRPSAEQVATVRTFVTANLVLGMLTVTAGALGHSW
jgi:uncharacterized membrane protein